MLNPFRRVATAYILLAAPFAGMSWAASAISPHEDLTSAILLLDLPCGQVVSARPRAGGRQLATCKSGDSYLIFMTAQGRVVAQKQ
jgi:hypothetical protein